MGYKTFLQEKTTFTFAVEQLQLFFKYWFFSISGSVEDMYRFQLAGTTQAFQSCSMWYNPWTKTRKKEKSKLVQERLKKK